MHKWMIIACSLDPSVLALSKLNGFSDLARDQWPPFTDLTCEQPTQRQLQHCWASKNPIKSIQLEERCS
ncbi:hypothetical protein T11_12844 [Trichinella zimbabwensis]|uniref:Uncharacterized protein n=2 Tax=Trichinella TaxID=6333 RepID=A0A0V1N5X5_9BILA|nr:hypothetical protein T11_12844 [Trichinella zimbabwensis]KRZ79431.1 hypothetical protein T10_5284 [Trichinella papuae]